MMCFCDDRPPNIRVLLLIHPLCLYLDIIYIYHIHAKFNLSLAITVDYCCASLSLSLSLSLCLSLSTQHGQGRSRPPAARVCSRFLPVKREFFLATVAKCLLKGVNVGSVLIFILYYMYPGKRLEITSVMIWRYINKIELN